MDIQAILPILLGEFYEKLNLIKDLTIREVRFPNAPHKIKVAIGMRRSGKTYFLYQQILDLIKAGVNPKTILYISFEDDRIFPMNEKTLAKFVDAFYSLYPENHDTKSYLFFDEIQLVEDWPRVIRRLHDTKNAELFLTGSSAKLLSKEIATALRGRSLAVEIWPYSFQEFMRAKKITIDRRLYDKKTQDKLAQLFHHYLSEGGFPEITPFDPSIKQQTLQEYLNVAIYRDIVERYEIKHPSLIRYLILSMVHSTGKPFAINKFYNDIKSQGYQIGKDLLYDYVDHIEDAYLAFSVGSFDKSFRKTQTKPKKLYMIDPGLVRAISLEYENDLGRLFENVVFLDLRRLGYKIDYYQTSQGYEVDFLAQTPQGKKKLFQITWDIQDPATLEREKRALEAARKELKIEGEIITLDSYLKKGPDQFKF